MIVNFTKKERNCMGVEPILPAGRATITLTITLIIMIVNFTKT